MRTRIKICCMASLEEAPNFPVEDGLNITEGIRAGGAIGDRNFELHSMPSAVPEPGMLGLALMAAGVALFAIRRRVTAFR